MKHEIMKIQSKPGLVIVQYSLSPSY